MKDEFGLVRRSQPMALVDPQTTDAQVITLWLHGKSPHTQRAYGRDITRFFEHVAGKQLHQVTLADVQSFSDALGGLAPASRCRALAAVKSVFSFAQQIGYVRFNPAAPVKLARPQQQLAKRFLSEAEVSSMIVLESNARNKLLLKVLYLTGLRVAEMAALTWGDLGKRTEGGQVSVIGKGNKLRTVLLPQHLWDELIAVRGDAEDDEPIFPSRKKGGHLDPSQLRRIVRGAAVRAGINKPVSPHWLRHAHACHALERGCPLHLLQASLGHASLAVTGVYLHARPSDGSARYLIQL